MQQLVFVVHNHQPVGNFDQVFADAYERCYRPFIEVCAEFPDVKIGLHYTGPLLEWLTQHRPQFLRDIKALVTRGQVEILGGGFFEPMLAVFPDADALGQIQMMREFCLDHFGAENTGMWLAERVWEPDLPRVLNQAGVKYTLLDDTHFLSAGLTKGELFGHYVTEKAGRPLSIFPIDKDLRYAIPWKPIPELERQLQELDRVRGNDPRCLTYGDDGEKFGLWPNTYEWVYGKGWLRDFFKLLTNRKDLVSTVLPREALTQTPPSGHVYLPTASYEEMGEWSLPTHAIKLYDELRDQLKHQGSYERYQPFVRGGIWQGFLAKYPETNHLHKRVLQVGERLRGSGSSDSPLLDEAYRQLYRSECNCAYWHGLFGGLYLNNLRHALWEALLKAERAFDVAQHGEHPFLTAITGDFDADLTDEVSVRTEAVSVVLRPRLGGSLLEIADLVRSFLLTDVLARREEGYHAKLRALDARGEDHAGQGDQPTNAHDLARSKEPKLSRFLVFDDYRRTAFRDRFHEPGFALEGMQGGSSGDVGSFAGLPYDLAPVANGDRDALDLTLSAKGTVRTGTDAVPVRIDKRYVFRKGRGGFDVRYELANAGDRPLKILFAPELNFSLLTGDADDRLLELPQGRRERLRYRGEIKELSRFSLSDGWAKLRLVVAADRPFDLWTYPIEAVSQSEGGFERTYQGSCFLLRTPLELAPGARVPLAFHVDIEH